MKVANVRMAETYRHTGKNGQQLSHTNWHSLTFYDNLADAALNCEKGDNLFVEGSLQQRQFTPADGVKRTVHEVVVRSFHVIAPARPDSTPKRFDVDDGSGVHGSGLESFEGGVKDADWPVGPA
jgi:single stranded DNA-binding protein